MSVGGIAVDHQSKTDPFRKGVDLFIGRTGTDLYPVAAVLNYLQARGTSQGPIGGLLESAGGMRGQLQTSCLC